MRKIVTLLVSLSLLMSSFGSWAVSAGSPTQAIAAPGGVYTVQLSPTGGLVISVGAEQYSVNSSFSYPYMHDGAWNRLGAANGASGGEWRWHAARSATSLDVVAVDSHYKLDRHVSLLNDRILVTDTFTNTSHDDIAIVFTNSVAPDQHPTKTYVAGVAGMSKLPNNASSPSANPTIFFSDAHSGLGMVALDDVFKLQLELGQNGGAGTFKDVNFGLAPGVAYTIEWVLYPQRQADYYYFVNAVRRDYVKPTTIEGGFAIMPYTFPLTHSRQEVAAWLTDRAAKLVVLAGPDGGAPWIGGYGQHLYNLKAPFDETDYIAKLRRAVSVLKSIDPGVKCLAPFETAMTPDVPAGDDSPMFGDSVAIGPDGKPAGYHFPHLAFARNLFVRAKPHNFIYYPTPTNSYYKFVKSTLQKVLNGSKVDGIYFDLFNYASPDFRWTYSKWDGHSVDVNLSNYTIARKKSDLAILSEAARIDLVKMVLDAKPGNVVVVNGLTMLRDISELSVMHYIESAMDYGYAQTVLSTPIVLGWTTGYRGGAARAGKAGKWWLQWNSEADYFDDIREKLASGNLYFTYWAPPGGMNTSNLTYPTILSHMYPITVTQLGPGLIEGRERIITLHSGTYSWGDMSTAKAYVYSDDGHEIQSKMVTVRSLPHVNSFRVNVPAGGAAVLERVVPRI